MPAYALYMDALTAAMGLADPTTAGMRAHRETFESVGEVAAWVADLGAAWETERRRVRIKVTDDDALAGYVAHHRPAGQAKGEPRQPPP